ncbi:MAG: DNA alkylation repair protein [Pseudomonadales bacterium]|nr:DNA alkylation repair protein [Pseudomonadales bacterium]
MAAQPLLKNGLNAHAISRISGALKQVYPDFNVLAFDAECISALPPLELKERVQHIITVMHAYLPDDFIETAALLDQIKSVWDYGEADDSYSVFAAWPVIDYVGEYGLQHQEIALPLLAELTSLFSAEFALRFFIIEHTELSLNTLLNWAEHEDEHIRRLASEGCRPRLPWGIRLQQFCEDPTPILPILEKLKNDDSEYVRRSVANNLNDIAKDHPDIVIDVCRKWHKDASKNTQWLIKHATRTLVKNGHPEVFPLLGFTEEPKVAVTNLRVNKTQLVMGESIEFDFELSSKAKVKQKMVVDYAIHYVKANGKTKAKVFKLKALSINAGDTLVLKKSQIFKTITTRKYYAGIHSIELLINGVAQASVDFELCL